MTVPRPDIELHAANLAAQGLTLDDLRNWDAGLWRGPRVLVPIVVEALVVTPQNAAGPWADVKFDVTFAPDAATPTIRTPAPFATYNGRPLGVHLHWALPDGLTRGTEVAPADAEAAGAASAATTRFPFVPDRWLVVRMFPAVPGGTDYKRRAVAWVIESEQDDPQLRVTPLATWRERRDATPRPRWLTAVGKGDPAYAAFYDNVQNVLGFYDALAGVTEGPISYLVTGWYSRLEDDPLYEPQTQDAWFEKLRDLGWTLEDGAAPGKAAEAAEAQARLSRLGLRSLYYTGREAGLTPVRDIPTTPLAPTDSAGLEAALAPAIPRIKVDPAIAGLAEVSARTVVTRAPSFSMYWPRQLLCHGMVYDVAWGGKGGTYNRRATGAPPARSVTVAVGNTGVESLAAVIAKKSATPNLEKIFAAFHYGSLHELDEPDGVARLEASLHAEDFASEPGGTESDTIEEGDLLPPGPAEGPTPGPLPIAVPIAAPIAATGLRQPLKIFSASFHSLLAGMVESPLVRNVAPPPSPLQRRTVSVTRPLPRFWRPNDPVVLLVQTKRSFKHGHDGMYTEDGTLVCRITGETITSVDPTVGTVTGTTEQRRVRVVASALTSALLRSGQVPDEAFALYHEALLLDESSAPIAALSILADPAEIERVAPPATVTRHVLTVESLTEKFRVEQTLLWNTLLDRKADGQALSEPSGLVGKMPSKLGVQPWQAPWTPLQLDWEVEWYPTPGLMSQWDLGQIDYELPPDADLGIKTPRVYSGRALLTPGVAAVLASRVRKFLEEEAAGAANLASGAQEAALREVVTAVSQMDVLSASLGGLHDAFIGRVERARFTPKGGTVPTIDQTAQSTRAKELFPVRAGHLRLRRLRVIDAFGQMYNVDSTALAQPIRAADMVVPPPPPPPATIAAPVTPPATPTSPSGTPTVPPRTTAAPPQRLDLLRLPPRIVQPSRLMFRFLSADDDTAQATKLRSPICGWIVPDHLDDALEVYNAEGLTQGQVQLRPDRSGLEWQGVPGKPGPLGGSPALENGHLKRFVDGLLAWGVRDSAERMATGERVESALSALLRMIDATLWTVDPVGREGAEHLATMIGRPLAVVRAQLLLELAGPPVTQELLRTVFAVRLGELTQITDGLLGYFVNDDYAQFSPIHESIAAQTRPAGPQEGFLSGYESVPEFYANFARLADPVSHRYINPAPVISLRPDQRVMLTLLLDPRAGVHATAGLVPRKSVELMREHIGAALDALTLTFRVGPVLTDPQTVRMPLPTEIANGWSWVRRTDATVWKEDAVVQATHDAHLGDVPVHVTEGWLKLSAPPRQ